jgi:hypothetical protein
MDSRLFFSRNAHAALYLTSSLHYYLSARVKKGTATNVVVQEMLVGLFGAKVFGGISPEHVAHEPMRWRFTEPIKLTLINMRPNKRCVNHQPSSFRAKCRRECTDCAKVSLCRHLNKTHNCLFMMAASGRQLNEANAAS